MPKNKKHTTKRWHQTKKEIKNEMKTFDPNQLQLEFDAIQIAIQQEIESTKGWSDRAAVLSTVSYSNMDILKYMFFGCLSIATALLCIMRPTQELKQLNLAERIGVTIGTPVTVLLAIIFDMTDYQRMPLANFPICRESIHSFLSKMNELGFLKTINEATPYYDFIDQTRDAIAELRWLKIAEDKISELQSLKVAKDQLNTSETRYNLISRAQQFGLFATTTATSKREQSSTTYLTKSKP